MEQDGKGVRGEFVQGGVIRRVGDANGSAGGCGNGHIYSVERFRVCEQGGAGYACGDWVYLV
jgi:hypothetical protein